MEIITSSSNPKIKAARALHQRKQREAQKRFLAEGIHLVGAAVEGGAPIEAIFYAPQLLKSQFALDLVEQSVALGVTCHATSPEAFKSLAGKENPQGILAVVYQQEKAIEELQPGTFPWGVACVAPQDAGNVGTILRTIDAVGASGLILLDGGVDPYHPTAVRASMGSIFHHPLVSSTFADFSQWAASHNYRIFGTSAHGSLDYRAIQSYQLPCILLMGDERQGLSPSQAEICQAVLRLPMLGRVTSLNLAVAAGVLLYDMSAKMEKSQSA